jgi:hypothetical protein
MRRVKCKQCGVVVEEVPWGAGKHSSTKVYMHFLGHWARKLSWKETAEEFRSSWDKVHDAVAYLVDWGLRHRVLGPIRAIGVDEIFRTDLSPRDQAATKQTPGFLRGENGQENAPHHFLHRYYGVLILAVKARAASRCANGAALTVAVSGKRTPRSDEGYQPRLRPPGRTNQSSNRLLDKRPGSRDGSHDEPDKFRGIA